MELSPQELNRYSRHLILPSFGKEAQLKLKHSKVLVVGTGGLGAPLLQYLTAAGVGTIGLVDFDVVDESNLQRQVLFSTEDVGKPKSGTAMAKLKAQNPHINFVEYNTKLTSENALEIIKEYDVVADGTDNFPTRYLVNDACVLLGKTNVYASIFQFEGQVSVFNAKTKEGRGPNYRDLFPTPPPPGMVPSCAEGGVLGVLPGIIGSIQASEVIKVVAEIGTPLIGKLFVFDVLDFSTRKLNVQKNPENPISGENPTITKLIDYEEFCGLKPTNSIKSISVEELKNMQDTNEDFVLIDVREPYEYESANLSGILMPKDEVEDRVAEIPKDKKVVIHCKSGARSSNTIFMLQEKNGYTNLYNLTGGILAWKTKYAPEMLVL